MGVPLQNKILFKKYWRKEFSEMTREFSGMSFEDMVKQALYVLKMGRVINCHRVRGWLIDEYGSAKAPTYHEIELIVQELKARKEVKSGKN